MKRVYSIIFMLIVFSFVNVKAVNTFEKIDMDVYLDNYGNASIEEKWYADIHDGTEGYREFKKLDNSQISNFIVSDETGQVYEILDKWNSSGYLYDKAYKSALVNQNDKATLYFGISSYGEKIYTLKYGISNIVKQYSDKQGIYFNFINMDQRVKEATIRIHSDIPFSLDNSRIWGLGYKGTIDFEEGTIVLKTTNELLIPDYMVALVRFDGNYFNTSITVSQSFDNIYDEAYKEFNEPTTKKKSNSWIWMLIVALCPIVALFTIVIINIFKKNNEIPVAYGKKSKFINFGGYGKILPKDVDYWRDIPCNKNINYAYWICYEYDLLEEKVLKKGIIGAYFLKWLNNDTIKAISQESKKTYSIDVSNELNSEDEFENYLYEIVKNAAGKNLTLESDEFEKYCKDHYNSIYNLGDKVDKVVINYLSKNGLVDRKSDYLLHESVKEEAIKTKGFIKYLNDFGSMDDKTHIEVKLWNEYLIFAELFGIADKVRNGFKKLYPQLKDQLLNLNYSSYIETSELFESVAKSFTTSCISGAMEGFKLYTNSLESSNYSHDYSGTSSSSGCGGNSSPGGSSAGGSSGGGFR